MSANKITLIELLNKSLKLNDFENSINIINKMIDDINAGYFYLGGQIKMSGDHYISLDDIQKVRDINKMKYAEYGGPCNSAEAMSMRNSLFKLNLIEQMIVLHNN